MTEDNVKWLQKLRAVITYLNSDEVDDADETFIDLVCDAPNYLAALSAAIEGARS